LLILLLVDHLMQW